jgi:hypothetical protein
VGIKGNNVTAARERGISSKLPDPILKKVELKSRLRLDRSLKKWALRARTRNNWKGGLKNI